MHIYFSGIGGAGIGPLALVAHQAGYEVSGSDMQPSQYTEMLQQKGVSLHIGQTKEQLVAAHQAHPIDWMVFSSAIFYTNPNHPELLFAQENNIKYSKRDEFLNVIINEHNLQLIAVAGTHGKTTTTALAVWILSQLGIPVSYSVGAKIGSASNEPLPMGHFDPQAKYFVYECDEFDRNFLSFKPYLSVITIVDWDHHDIYPTADDYKQAFRQYINQSQTTFIFDRDAQYLDIQPTEQISIVGLQNEQIGSIKFPGLHNRQNAWLTAQALCNKLQLDEERVLEAINRFPGVSRRFELIAPNIYSDYAHTPEEVTATLQLANELSDQVVAVYEPLTNRRQHYMQDLYHNVFESVKKVYWLPSYLAREDPNQTILTPEQLIAKLSTTTNAQATKRDDNLLKTIKEHARAGDLVICLAGGGGDSLDEWLKKHRDELTN
jgi:UDP-N-acetylmuramate--alanine ligase